MGSVPRGVLDPKQFDTDPGPYLDLTDLVCLPISGQENLVYRTHYPISIIFFFLYVFFGEPAVHFSQFFPLLPLTEVSPRPSAIPDGNPPVDSQSVVGWGDAGFEPGTAGQQSGALPLSHHASH